MFSRGRKRPRKSVKPPLEDPALALCDFHEEDGDPTVFTKAVKYPMLDMDANPEKSSDFDNLCKKKPASLDGEDTVFEKQQKQQPSTGIFEDIRAEIQDAVDKFEGSHLPKEYEQLEPPGEEPPEELLADCSEPEG